MVSCEVRYTDGHGYDEIIIVNIDSLPVSEVISRFQTTFIADWKNYLVGETAEIIVATDDKIKINMGKIVII